MRAISSRLGRCARLAALSLSACLCACASAHPVADSARRREHAVESPPAATVESPPAPPRRVSWAERRAGDPQLLATPADRPPLPLSAMARSASGGSRTILFFVDDLDFAPGATGLDARDRAELDRLAGRLRRLDRPYWLEIQGHADATGSDADNLYLALLRAEAVRSYLSRAAGVPRDRIAVVSLGASRPSAPNGTVAGRARNRRAIVLVLR